jgi:hypothetical protein
MLVKTIQMLSEGCLDSGEDNTDAGIQMLTTGCIEADAGEDYTDAD